jgi:protein subunit release factor B
MAANRDEVLAHLLRAAEWSASRSSGSGGQHRDKASTRAELNLTRDSLAGLPSSIVEKLSAALGLDDRPLRISVQDERSLSRNQEVAAQPRQVPASAARGQLALAAPPGKMRS